MSLNYALLLVDCNDQVIGNYGVFKSRYDLYNYLGILINDSLSAVTINYLVFYDPNFGSFESWVKSVIDKDGILCIYTCGDQVFRIILEK